MSPPWVYPFGFKLAETAKAWGTDQLEQLECTREWLRGVLLQIGVQEKTEVLVDFYVAITVAQVTMAGLDATDIDQNSVGAPRMTKPLSDLKLQNCYQLRYFKKTFDVVKKMLPTFYDVDKVNTLDLQWFCDDIDRLLGFEEASSQQ